MKKENKKVCVPLTEEESVDLWLATLEAHNHDLLDTLSIAMIKQGVSLPTSKSEILVEFYYPWLVDQGFIENDCSKSEAKGKVLQFTNASMH